MNKIIIGFASLILFGCRTVEGPSVVTYEVKDREAFIYVDNEIWDMKAVSGFDYLDMAQKAGVNTIRTWGLNNLNNGRLLDEAHKRGMKVLVGLWLAHHQKGIDYTIPADSIKIRKQYERITQGILKYKDHPAVLAWGVANEINARNAPIQVWNAVNDIAKFIKAEDPNHPTSTVLAGSKYTHIENVMNLAPAIDILGINSYLDTKSVRENIKRAQWKNPYMVTELGPDGFWESDTTFWGAPIEVSSSIAARMYIERFTMVNDDPLCIGVFPFKWGSAPKKTPTWLSIFLSDSSKTQSYDELYCIWNSTYPGNRAPQVKDLRINNQSDHDNLYLKTGEAASAVVEAMDFDGDELTYKWEVLPEIQLKPGIQGTQKITVKPLKSRIATNTKNSITFHCPEKPGPYRLYVYVYDGNQSCGYANMPFFVN